VDEAERIHHVGGTHVGGTATLVPPY